MRAATMSIDSLRDEAGGSDLRVSLPVRIWRAVIRARRHQAERQMALAVLELDHPDVIADFRRARRD
jgi:hypothetical protein